MLSLICGSLVEGGGSAPLLLSAVMNLLVQKLKHIKDYVHTGEDLEGKKSSSNFLKHRDCRQALALRYPPQRQLLCRDKEGRKEWEGGQGLIELVDEDAEIVPFYLKRVLGLLDDKDLVVLDKNGRAFLVPLVGFQVVMCHCFAHQHAILKSAGPTYLNTEPTDPLAVRYAHSNGLNRED